MTSQTSSNTVVIFAYSGPSNVGQIAHQAALELTPGGLGQIHGLAGVGGHLDT